MKRTFVIAALVLGCGDDSMMANPDGPATADAAVDAPNQIDAPGSNADAGPLCASSDGGAVGTHKLFLNFGDEPNLTITHGATGCQNDATRNCSFIAMTDTVIPQFASGVTNRQALLDGIVAGVNQVLAPYSVDVVTTRPASGPYSMVVFAPCVSSLSCSGGGGALAPNDCNNANGNDIAFVFDQGTTGTANGYANLTMFDVGIVIGVSTNQVQGDCLCDSCGSNMLCTLSTDSVIHQAACNQNQVGMHQNEQSMFSAALGCRF